MNNDKKAAAARLKFISWNAGKKPIIPSLGDEIERTDLNTLMSIAETNNLADLSSIGYIGWRHSKEIMRGLCVYISAELQHYTSIKESKYSLHGAINLPAIDGTKPISVGFLCTYRSPHTAPYGVKMGHLL